LLNTSYHLGTAPRVSAMSEVAVPDARPDWVESGPDGTCFPEVQHFHEIDSTNRYLVDVARRQPLHGLVAVADHQSAGRGRLGRSWQAPPKANLLVSVLLVPDLRPDQLHLCSVAAALASADACRRAASLDPDLKWPNDLLVGDRKLAGILAESTPAQGVGDGLQSYGHVVVVGIGLNVRWPPADDSPAAGEVPGELRHSATSIGRETGRELEPARLLPTLLTELDRRISELVDVDGRQRLAAEYRRRCGTLGREVRVLLADQEIRGVALDLTPEGHLVVDCGACFTTVSAGDVVHLHREP
jgi:BirA family transcriptional regulator, biotin operon repressor / biotin---[acetyl-CoA-carboxylase] ligase